MSRDVMRSLILSLGVCLGFKWIPLWMLFHFSRAERCLAKSVKANIRKTKRSTCIRSDRVGASTHRRTIRVTSATWFLTSRRRKKQFPVVYSAWRIDLLTKIIQLPYKFSRYWRFQIRASFFKLTSLNQSFDYMHSIRLPNTPKTNVKNRLWLVFGDLFIGRRSCVKDGEKKWVAQVVFTVSEGKSSWKPIWEVSPESQMVPAPPSSNTQHSPPSPIQRCWDDSKETTENSFFSKLNQWNSCIQPLYWSKKNNIAVPHIHAYMYVFLSLIWALFWSFCTALSPSLVLHLSIYKWILKGILLICWSADPGYVLFGIERYMEARDRHWRLLPLFMLIQHQTRTSSYRSLRLMGSKREKEMRPIWGDPKIPLVRMASVVRIDGVFWNQ